MLRCTIRSAAALLTGGILLLTPLAASAQQPGGDQKPPEQAQGEQKPDDQKAAEQAKAEQAEAAKAIADYKEAAEKLPGSAGAPECVWTGRRIASRGVREPVRNPSPRASGRRLGGGGHPFDEHKEALMQLGRLGAWYSTDKLGGPQQIKAFVQTVERLG